MAISKKQIYTFLGLPASGKGTQARVFAFRRDIKVIGIGDLVRKKLENGDSRDPFVAEIRKRYDDGIPQRDEVVFDLVKDVLDQSESGLVFDNFPFTAPQAGFLDHYIENNNLAEPVIIYLKVDPATVLKRIIRRRVCSECGAVYTGEESSICEKCGGALVSRSDDNEDTVRTRIGQYLPRINEVVEAYSRKGRVIVVDGEPSVPEVEKAVEEAVAAFGSKS